MEYELDRIEETERIKKAFRDACYSNHDQSAVRRFFRLHQQKLFQLGKEKNVGELNYCLESDYQNYIDLAYPSCEKITEQTRSSIKTKLPAIRSLKSFDENLLQIALAPLISFTEEPKIVYPIYRINFYRELATALEECTDDKSLVEKLCLINFNSMTFFNYCKQKIKELLVPKQTLPEELYTLGKLQNYFGHIRSPAGSAYNHLQVPVSVMLSDWLKLFFELKEREMNGNYTSEDQTGGKHIDSKKVITSLTIGELGLIIRLFILSGVFRTSNKKALARFLSRIVVTQYKNINEAADDMHLYAAIIGTTETTLDTVQAILNRMLNKLQKIRREMKEKKKMVQ